MGRRGSGFGGVEGSLLAMFFLGAKRVLFDGAKGTAFRRI
jgi:hypothetical protein